MDLQRSKIASLILSVLVIVGSASCAGGGGGGGGGGAGVDVTGQWNGFWASSDGVGGGNLSIVLTQSGTSVTGSASFTNASCFTGGSVSGSVSGDTFLGAMTAGGIHVSFVTTISGPTDDDMNGTYAVNSGGACTGDTGTVSLTRP